MAGTLSKRPPKSAMSNSKPKQREKKGIYHCTCCGTDYTKRDGNFFKSASTLYLANGGYVPICRSCLENYFTEELLPAFDNDERRAVEAFCAICDWPYSDTAFDMAKKVQLIRDGGIMCTLYASKVRLSQVIKFDGEQFIDTIKKKQASAAEAAKQDEKKRLAKEQAESNGEEYHENVIDPSLEKEFGPGYSADEYAYLDEQLQDWCTRYESGTKAMEECLKAICVAQLNMRRAQQAGDSKAASDAIKSFQDLLNTTKLSPKQNKEDQLAQEESFGTLIKKWEDEQPIPEPEDKFKDVDGIKKLVTVFFFGHLCKMFNVKNDYSELYDSEMSKYTVTKPRVDDDTDDDEQRIDSFFEAAKNHDEKPSGEDGD